MPKALDLIEIRDLHRFPWHSRLCSRHQRFRAGELYVVMPTALLHISMNSDPCTDLPTYAVPCHTRYEASAFAVREHSLGFLRYERLHALTFG